MSAIDTMVGGTLAQTKSKQGPGRLKSRPDFLAVRKGEARRGPFFLLEVLDHKNGARPRVGYTVTKKHGNAVERNRMRRRLREAVRTKAGFEMSPGHDYVIVARRDILSARFDILGEALVARIKNERKAGTTRSPASGNT